ncbi:hypothetical protein TNCV_1805421 [Trichonephila clavipes]|nr:hypothetical protein TNCV_1805421 [Trichonephila clavipes]
MSHRIWGVICFYSREGGRGFKWEQTRYILEDCCVPTSNSYAPFQQSFSHFSEAQHVILGALKVLGVLQMGQVLLTSSASKRQRK